MWKFAAVACAMTLHVGVSHAESAHLSGSVPAVCVAGAPDITGAVSHEYAVSLPIFCNSPDGYVLSVDVIGGSADGYEFTTGGGTFLARVGEQLDIQMDARPVRGTAVIEIRDLGMPDTAAPQLQFLLRPAA